MKKLIKNTTLLLLLFINIGCEENKSKASMTIDKSLDCIQEREQALIKSIPSLEYESICFEGLNIAMFWALTGNIDHANELQQIVDSIEGWDKSKTPLVYQALAVINSNYKSEKLEIKEFNRLNWECVFKPAWKWHNPTLLEVEGASFQELTGDKVFYKAQDLSYAPNSSDCAESVENLKSAYLAFQKYFTEKNPVGHDYFLTTTSLILISNRLGLKSESKKHLRKWGQGICKYKGNYQPELLLRDISTSKLLLEKDLGKLFNISAEHCEKILQEIKISLSKRLNKGKQYALNNLSINEILTSLSIKSIEGNEIDLSEGKIKQQWLGYDPVNKNSINDVEKRLGVKLPKEYIKFLNQSNGFSAWSPVGASLLPVEEIDWLRNKDKELISIWGAYDSEMEKNLNSALLIGGLDEEQHIFLIPDESYENWECWFFASWIPGEIKYDNFRFYLESELIYFN